MNISAFGTKVKTFVEEHTPNIPDSYYRRVGSWMDRLHDVSGVLDNATGLGHNLFDVAYQSSVINGTPVPELASFRDNVLTARILLSGSRIITTLEKLFSGKFFFKQNPDGTFLDSAGKKKLRDCLDIAADIALLGARILAPISWTLHLLMKHDGYPHLKKHAKNIGIGLCTFYTACTLICTVASIKNLISAESRAEHKEAILDFVGCILDCVYAPWENGAIMFEVHPAVHLVGAVLGVIAHTYSLVRKVVSFDIKETVDFNAPTNVWDSLA